MASQTGSPVPAPSAQVVASAFVEQYYTILHQSPELVYRFYQEQSVLSHPGPNGDMTSVTTTEAINDKILSLNCKDFKVELRTVDAQDSYQGGVSVLVTGWHMAIDEVRRKFIQSFFLAPQDKGFFVLNDIFRYVDEDELVENSSLSANNVSVDGPAAPLTPDQDRHEPAVEATPSVSEEEVDNGDVSGNQSEETSAVEEDVVPVAPSSQYEIHPVVEATTLVPEDGRKKSYASIVKVMKESKASTPVNVSNSTVKAASATVEKQPLATAAPASEASAPTNTNSIPESSIHHEEAESHSIYVRSLPLNILDSQLEEEFKKFGPINPGGVQVRSNKGFCFGFVEFESSSSVHSAIEASPIIIGGKQAYVEEKRATSRGSGNGSGRGQFSLGRGASSGGFRSDSFRVRTNFSGRGSFGRGDYGTRGSEYGSRGRGPSRREGYQLVDLNGRGGAARSSGGSNNSTVPA
ncbi:nuclear transport factor 2-like isoform X2 [Aristolochia californica]|uniref:nuclear transport factor 2-like isoform X2 n=1 Tax=Aristolochia californica TaxID=171875 RepID=UPI0035DD1A76